jgi:uncharacterized damage-inducible protein DinB
MKFALPAHPELHPYLAAVASSVEFGKNRLIQSMQGLTPEQLHATPAGFTNSVATLVLHVAAANVSFAHRLKGERVPDELKAVYKLDQPQSPLPVAVGETVESLTEKLERATALLIETLGSIKEPNLEQEIPFGKEHTATMPFVYGVISIHPTLHHGQIQMLLKALKA